MRPEVTIFGRAPFRTLSRRSFLAFGAATIVVPIIAGTGPVAAAGDQNAPKVSYMTPDAAHRAALAGEIILIDIRRPDEWLETKVGEGAVGLDMREDDFVPALVTLRRANPDMPIALICRTGNRSGYVTSALAGQGFPGLVDVNEGMAGGANGPGWLKRGLPTYDGTPANVTARRKALLP